ncbi:MAG: hypothetical protein WBQ23_02935 [Bacteroidota bacterium]
MQERTSTILKKVLIHVLGWPLFLVALFLCFIGGMYIGWAVQFFTSDYEELRYLFTGVWISFAPLQDDNRTVLIFFIGGTAVLSFLSSYLFATFIFKRKILKMIFSSLIALSCLSFMSWLAYESIVWSYERTVNIGCVLGTTSLKDQLCARMSEQERKKFMIDNDITEKDLRNYRRRYPERFE